MINDPIFHDEAEWQASLDYLIYDMQKLNEVLASISNVVQPEQLALHQMVKTAQYVKKATNY